MNDQLPSDDYVAIAEELTKHFKSGPAVVRAVDGVGFRLPRGKMVALRGPSGCGKSTLLNLIGALDRPDSGRLIVDGVDVSRLSGGGEVAYRRRKVGFVFQQFNLVPQLSATENVTLPMEFVGGTNGASRSRARELLRRVGLAQDRHERRPAKLSGGEQQRVAIARALANEPAILLMDEPTGRLDSESGRRVLELIQALRRQRRLTVVLVTHDTGVAARADRIVRMLDGRMVGEKAPAARPPA